MPIAQADQAGRHLTGPLGSVKSKVLIGILISKGLLPQNNKDIQYKLSGHLVQNRIEWPRLFLIF